MKAVKKNFTNGNTWKLKELEKLLSQKSIELENKNHELEIESSLERVRAIALGMRKSEDLLNVCERLFKELKTLGFDELRNTMINIHNDKEETFLNYDYSDTLGKTITPLYYDIHPIIKKQIKQIRKGRNAFSETSFKGDELREWRKFRKKRGEPDDPRLNKCKALHYYFYSIGRGSIGISTFNPISKEKLRLLKRFGNVFDFAYRRYMDVALAEEQTKKAKIELSLERVRARSMAMHSSEELVDAAIVLFNELKSLGIESIRTGVAIVDESKRAVEIWSSELIEKERNKILGIVPFKTHPFFEGYYKAWKRKEKYFEYEVTGNEVKKYYKVTSAVLSYPLKKKFNPKESFYTFFFPEGSLNVVSQKNLSEEECSLMIRFANVFGMIYRRFLDLQKAEAQAKEATIEASLERLRSKTMAMHNSRDVGDTVATMLDELMKLDVEKTVRCGVIIIDDSKHMEVWNASFDAAEKISLIVGRLDMTIHPSLLGVYKAWKTNQLSYSYEFSGKDLIKYFSAINNSPDYPLQIDLGSLPSKYFNIEFFFKEGAIFAFTQDPLTPETEQIFIRFAGVFGQTYRRYLDLQKAEAQAREAQIELALERVRARTMAMQNSDELQEAAILLFQQLRDLGIDTGSCGYIIWDKNGKNDAMVWMSSPEGEIQSPFKLSHAKSKIYKEINSAKEEGKELFVKEVKGAELKRHFDYLTTVPGIGEKIKQLRKARYKFPDAIVYNSAFFKQGYLSFHTHNQSPEAFDIFKRFANVFEQTYTRFLDLQKAEAQAREAQIELGLERVRARAMAMQNSKELSELVDTVFKELTKLDFALTWCIINIIDESSMTNSVWAANPDIDIMPENYHMKFEDYPFHDAMFKGWKERDTKFVYVIEGREKLIYDDYLFSETEFRKVPKEAQEASRAMKRYVATFSFSNFGGLQTVGEEPLSEENLDILERFGKVFDLTYTRFNDLLKAESQAREAQIEAALERVRSRTMGMQNSEELKEVIQVVYEQFVNLNIYVEHAGFIIDYKENDDMHIWLADRNEIPTEVTFPYFDCAHWNSFIEAKEKGLDFFANHLTFKEKNKFYKDLFKLIPGVPEETVKYYYSCPGLAISTVLLEDVGLYIENFSGIPYTDEENKTLMRFGNVFQQTYTRFNDLKQAEAQAREAQIEASLEKVRGRAMSMHKSDELLDAGALLYSELSRLGIASLTIGYVLMDEEEKMGWNYTANPADGSIWNAAVGIPHNETEILKAVTASWKKQEPFHIVELDPEQTIKHQTFIAERSVNFPYSAEELISFSPERITLYNFNFKQGYVLIVGAAKLSTEQEEMMVRFTKVFEMTYRRFLDLQKAEAQVREAQIETALEKVRSQTMGMQTSEDLSKVAAAMFDQIRMLGGDLFSCGIVLCDENKNEVDQWLSAPDIGMMPPFFVPKNLDFIHQYRYDKWKAGVELFSIEIPENKIAQHFELLFALPSLKNILDSIAAKGLSLPEVPKWEIDYGASFKYGYILISALQPFNEAHIFPRFAKVFEQTYTRFLDLQKAEAQARESQIEAALEKVRGKAMAMHNSADLTDAAGQVFTELNNLGFKPIRCGFVLLSKNSRRAKLYPAASFDYKNIVSFTGEFEFTGHPVYEKQYESWQKKENYFPVLEGEVLKSYYKILAKGLSVPYKNFLTKNKKQFGTFLPFTEGFLFTWSDEPYSETDIKILDRFKAILDLTIRRYLDLQKAEAQAREAKVEAALERARTQSMLMQHSNELNLTSEVFHEQLQLLGIDSEFSFVWLPDEKKNEHLFWTAWSENKNGSVSVQSRSVIYPLDKTERYTAECFRAWESNEPLHEYFVPPDEVNDYFAVWAEVLSAAKHLKAEYFKKGIYYTEAFIKYGCFGVELRRPLTDEEKKILLRFAIEFERAYTRFLDLQKAEAQAREAQIEAALEKVRSRSLAMHKADELGEVITVVVDKLKELDFSVSDGVALITYSEGSKDLLEWMTNPGFSSALKFNVPYFEHPVLTNLWKAKNEGIEFIMERYTAEENKSFLNHIFEHSDFKHTPQPIKDYCLAADTYATSIAFQTNTSIFINDYSGNSLSEHEIDILKRFSNVFEQAYVRFLDLQKAEAQAREAQIEAALERVRSRTLAMHKSDELAETAAEVFRQLISLGISPNRLYIGIDKDKENEMELWVTDEDGNKVNTEFSGKMNNNITFKKMYDGWKSKKKSLIIDMQGKELEEYFRYLTEDLKVPFNQGLSQKRRVQSLAYFTKGFIGIASPEPQTEDTIILLERFASVFNLTFTRFNDLKQAEAQAREAQIEVALERIRSRTMAMQKSEELSETAFVLYQQFLELGESPDQITIGIFNEEEKVIEFRTTMDGKMTDVTHKFPYEETELMNQIYAAWKDNKKSLTREMKGKELHDYIDYRIRLTGMTTKEDHKHDRRIVSVAFFSKGVISISTTDPRPKETVQLLERFAGVFDLTYRRFLDLKQAEAQAKEAQIEAALERVRSQTMAMNKSQDLEQVVSVIFKELDRQDLKSIRCGIGIINDKNRSVNVWTTTKTNDGFNLNFSGNESMDVHPLLQGVFNAWGKQEDYHYKLEGEDLIKYYQTMTGDNYRLPDAATGADVNSSNCQFYYCTLFSAGGLFLFREIPFEDDLTKIIKRFGNAFSLAYKRFEDLKQSEARALEAIKESSLDRVRAEISSMRSTEDLNRITPLIWRELQTLEVPFFRCGVFIIDEISEQVQVHLSAPDGHSLAAMNLPFKANALTKNSVEHWRKGLVYTEHWNKEEFINWTKTMLEEGRISDTSKYQDTTTPPESLDLHFVPFTQGMIYVGNDRPLLKEKIDMVKSLADTFAIAYSRYEDFNNLEKAKKSIETTLTELKATQSQLIQSEKMASLGELTAGIAHEIQNPLNFVNNFSEVNTELIDELNEELSKGNYEDAMELAKDIKDNEEKIKHHGKRAEAIVKGMLQHSRTSSGVKEPANINTLTDEYLRLAYHGLRAKDKTFNAKMETDFDESIEMINIISQDIGRVILNLITNAFYVVGEKKKSGVENYEPTVSVSTKKNGDKVEVRVKDNGNGIPQKVLDKIFQPFFTTKPTGQGTGLGLSLSYDIVKAHGGELKVETKEGEGSEFVIELPLGMDLKN